MTIAFVLVALGALIGWSFRQTAELARQVNALNDRLERVESVSNRARGR